MPLLFLYLGGFKMYKEDLKLNGKYYEVKITRKARVEIEEKQRNDLRKKSDSPEFLDTVANMDKLVKIQEELDQIDKMEDGKEKEKKINAYNKKYIPLMLKAEASQAFDDVIDKYDLIYILIRANPNNQSLSKDEYDKGLDDLEDEIGLIELEKKFTEMSNKVFTELEAIKKALSQPLAHQEPKVN